MPEGVPESHAYGRKKGESLCGDMRESQETKPEMNHGDVTTPPAPPIVLVGGHPVNSWMLPPPDG